MKRNTERPKPTAVPKKPEPKLKVIIEPEIKGLPNKELLRPDEVARYFSVTERTVRLWCEHGHLESVKVARTMRVTRESVVACRFNN